MKQERGGACAKCRGLSVGGWTWVVAVPVICLGPESAGAGPLFGPRTDYATGSGPISVAIADLNADGWADVVVVDRNSNGVSVLLGRGDGTLVPKSDFGISGSPMSIVVADLNLDGHPDLVMGSEGSAVYVLRGNGDGTFGAETAGFVGQLPFSVGVADLNGDGQTDVVAANYYDRSSAVSVLMGMGDGTLGSASNIGWGLGPIALGIADLNADGRPDLVVANGRRDFVSTYLGNGDGTFAAHTDMGVGIQPTSLKVVDLNSDGSPDLVVAGQHQTVNVFVGNGDGTFGFKGAVAVGVNPNSIAVADLDLDGKLDLAVANEESNSVSVATGNGDGTFQVATDLGSGDVPSAVALGDLNGDGKPDLVVANFGSNTVSVRLNTTPATSVRASLSIAPVSNPVKGGLKLAITLPSAERADVEVFDVAGRMAGRRTVASASGREEIALPEAAGWKPGVYLVRVRQGGRIATSRACVVL